MFSFYINFSSFYVRRSVGNISNIKILKVQKYYIQIVFIIQNNIAISIN